MSETNKEGKFDRFLDDVAEEGATYIKPNIEMKLSRDKRQACRDIVLEIKNYGVTQRQIWFLIHLLSLELENQELVRAIAEVIGDNREKIPVLETKKSKLILPTK